MGAMSWYVHKDMQLRGAELSIELVCPEQMAAGLSLVAPCINNCRTCIRGSYQAVLPLSGEFAALLLALWLI